MDKVLPYLVLLALIGAFVFTYIANKKTPKPEGCDDLNCEGCAMTSCSHNTSDKKGE